MEIDRSLPTSSPCKMGVVKNLKHLVAPFNIMVFIWTPYLSLKFTGEAFPYVFVLK